MIAGLASHFRDFREYGFRVVPTKISSLLWRLYRPLAAALLFGILRLLQPLIWVKIGSIDTLRFGHHVAGPWFYLLRSQSLAGNGQTRHFHVFFPGLHNPNPHVLQMWRRRIRVWPGWMIGGGVPNKWVTRETRLNRGHLVETLDFEDGMVQARYNPIQLDLTMQEERDARQAMSQIGLPVSAKWVALVVRDSAWLEHVYPSVHWRNNDYRDSYVDSYVLACQALLNRGWYVIRLGARVREAMSLSDPKFIDYATSRARSEVLDLYLASRCSFMISTGTGLDIFAALHRIPLLYVNFFPYCLTNPKIFGQESHVIFKHYIDESGNRLSLTKIMHLGLENPYGLKDLSETSIRLEDNSPEEIAEAVIAMHAFHQRGFSPESPTNLQIRVSSIVAPYMKDPYDAQFQPKVVNEFLIRNPEWTR